MKKLCLSLLTLSFFAMNGHSQLLKKLGDKVKDKANQRVDQKTDQAIDKGLDKTEDATKKKDGSSSQTGNTNTTNTNGTKDTATGPAQAAPSIKVYSNYDFVPGDKILFEDHFADDQDGEFPIHWELIAGQAVLNKNNGEEALYLTDGNYVRLAPRVTNKKYLTDPFTVEYDYYYIPGAYGSLILFKGINKDGYEAESGLHVGNGESSFDGTWGSVSLSKSYPEDLRESFDNKWHHVAIIMKNHQIKVYVDQYRILVVPDAKEEYSSLQFAGIGDDKEPIVLKNIRIAAGGNMNMIGKKFTETKIVTHGINFDIDKATIKPESMGTLNMIVQVLKDNPDVKFEVGGHTDNTGTAVHNLTLSQQRADAVKDQLVKMGVDAARLTSKGFGDTKPISDNTSPEGKANNRRVEFVKQ
jgi:outer membrane protein OmpA-like peptidoglycan-associated protein